MFGQLAVQIIGKPLAWRIGRAIYLLARDEAGNEIDTNGEADLIRAVVAAKSDQRPIRFWDVGGNLGDWSQVAAAATAAAGLDCTIDIFEPAPESASHLAQRFAEKPSARVHQVALADAPGSGFFEIVSSTGGTNGLVSDAAMSANAIKVSIDTADAVRARLSQDHIDLIKIDAEGHDLSILTGLRETLAAGAVDCVQFEYNQCWIATGASLFKVFGLIADLPYVLATVHASGFDIMPCWNAEADRYFETNYVLIRKDRVAAIGARQCRWDASNVLVAAR